MYIDRQFECTTNTGTGNKDRLIVVSTFEKDNLSFRINDMRATQAIFLSSEDQRRLRDLLNENLGEGAYKDAAAAGDDFDPDEGVPSIIEVRSPDRFYSEWVAVREHYLRRTARTVATCESAERAQEYAAMLRNKALFGQRA